MPTVLCADDFALSRGVSDGILELIGEGRLSATSALVTMEDWPRSAGRLADVRALAAVGLHLNLTLGSPLGPVPCLAPRGQFPNVAALMRLAFAGRLVPTEIDAEIGRQFDRFEACFGHPPDFIDGHEHVHVLPGVRGSLLRAVKAHRHRDRILVRDPSDRIASIARRRVSVGKAMLIRALATGFGAAVTAAGALKNDSFAGFTSFEDRSGFAEFDRFLLYARGWHVVMCHPGHLDRGLRGDRAGGSAAVSHAARRREEYGALRRKPGLSDLIWHPDRAEAEAAAGSVFIGARPAALPVSPAGARPAPG